MQIDKVSDSNKLLEAYNLILAEVNELKASAKQAETEFETFKKEWTRQSFKGVVEFRKININLGWSSFDPHNTTDFVVAEKFHGFYARQMISRTLDAHGYYSDLLARAQRGLAEARNFIEKMKPNPKREVKK